MPQIELPKVNDLLFIDVHPEKTREGKAAVFLKGSQIEVIKKVILKLRNLQLNPGQLLLARFDNVCNYLTE